MDIKIGEYKLLTDSEQFIVARPRKNKTGKNKGEIIDTDKTYHPNVESALNNLLQRKLIKSDAETLSELKNDLNAFKTELREFWNMEVV